MGVMDVAGHFPNFVANLKYHLGCGVVAQFGLVDFQPQAFRALAEGNDF
jgi:hypothetical protein